MTEAVLKGVAVRGIRACVPQAVRTLADDNLIPDEAEREPYYLYIDEAQTVLQFASADFETILTRARKYRLCLTIANQIPTDLPEGILKKIGIFGTRFLFNLDSQNTQIFDKAIKQTSFGRYSAEDLQTLPKFRAIAITNNRAYLVKTPKPLGFSNASYAKIITKRFGENSIGGITSGPHTENHAASSPDKQFTAPPAHTPAHRSKKGDKGTAG